MDNLTKLIGEEHSLQKMSRALADIARREHPAAVGALHVTCADEVERECAEAFQRGFVQHLLPELKYSKQSAFRIGNLGGRYEWGAIRLAEQHFAPPPGRSGVCLIVAKVNAHVGVVDGESRTRNGDAASERYGAFMRQGGESECCGMLASILAGGRSPFGDQMRELFHAEGKDRLAAFGPKGDVSPELAPLYIAIASARLQARQVMLDVQDHTVDAPILYLIAPCVTLNRREHDTEILCGLYTADYRTAKRREEYQGLGDDASLYRLTVKSGRLHVSEDEADDPRVARDHRALVLEEWRRRRHRERSGLSKQAAEEMKRVLPSRDLNGLRKSGMARAALKASIPFLAEVTPASAAVLLFAYGAAGMYHVYRAHRLARDLESDTEAREMLDEVHAHIDNLSDEQAQAVAQALAHEYGVQ